MRNSAPASSPRDFPRTEGLANIPYLEEVLHESYRCFTRLADWGYGNGPIASNQNANSMAFLRKKLTEQKVKILDHSPAIELLLLGRSRFRGRRRVEKDRRNLGGARGRRYHGDRRQRL